MEKQPRLIRITTVPLSLEKLLEGQLNFMQKEYEVIAISSEEKRLQEFGEEIGVKTFPVEMTRKITPKKDLVSVLKLYKFFKKTKPLIVHTHTPKAGIVGMIASKMAGVPIRLHTVAGLPPQGVGGVKWRVFKYAEKATFACATKVFPNSMKMYDFLLKNKYTSTKKLKVVGKGSSNGIDTGYFNPSNFSEEEKSNFRKSLKIPLNDLVFIFVGRLVKDKGINELAEVFTKLSREFREISLLLVGPFETDLDPLKSSTMETLKDHPKIFEVGYQSDVRPFLACADVLAFPSYREGFPNVVMQAGAMGLPCIVTDINGCNEIIEEGINGTIVPVRDEDSLYRAMKKMITDVEFRKMTGKRSRKIIKENYERQEIWKALLAEYKMLESQLKK